MALFANDPAPVAAPKKRPSKKGAAKEERRSDAYVPQERPPLAPCPKCGWSTAHQDQCGWCRDLDAAYAKQKERIGRAKTLPASYALDEPERLEAEHAARKQPCRIARCRKCGLVFALVLHGGLSFREVFTPSTYAEGLCNGCTIVKELFLQLAQRRALMARARGTV